MSILQDVATCTGRVYENPTPLGARKLSSLVITMLMSILQDVGSYMGRAYENPNMGYLISTLIDARKLCSLVISMLMSILQDVATYTRRAYDKHTDRCTKIMQFGHKHVHEHITRCWYIYEACL